MPDLLVMAVGESNMRGLKKAAGGNRTIPANCQTFNNDELKLGSKFVPMAFGRYPLNIIANDDRWANNLALSFCREASATYRTRLLMVAKGGHPIEAFLPKTVRSANVWPLKAGKFDMSPYLYNTVLGAAAALRAAKKSRFDVVIFHQGEANSADTGQKYILKFKEFRKQLIKYKFISSETKIITGGISPVSESYAKHKNAMLDLSAEIPAVRFADSNGLPLAADNIHFTGDGLTTFGQRYWAKFQSA